MRTLELALKIKEVRDLQKAYFASRNGRYADKKLLAASKAKERELDADLDQLFSNEGLMDRLTREEENEQVVEVATIFQETDIDIDPY